MKLCLDRKALTAEELIVALSSCGCPTKEGGQGGIGTVVLGLFRCSLGPSLPDGIFGIPQMAVLRELHLGCNKLEVLPSSVGSLSLLEMLSVQGNLLEGIPPSIGQLSSLTSLDAGNNRLKELPEAIGRCCALRIFELSGNEVLRELPKSLSSLGHLAHLGLKRTGSLVAPPRQVADLGAAACLAWLKEGRDADPGKSPPPPRPNLARD